MADAPHPEMQKLRAHMDELRKQVDVNTRDVADLRTMHQQTNRSMDAIAKSLETMVSRLGVIEGYVATFVNVRQFVVWLWPVVVAVLIIFGSRAF